MVGVLLKYENRGKVPVYYTVSISDGVSLDSKLQLQLVVFS